MKLDAGADAAALRTAAGSAKETILADAKLDVGPGDRARSRQQGHRRHDQGRADSRPTSRRVLVDGFFPECAPDAEPLRKRTTGLQELGLPYVGRPGRHQAPRRVPGPATPSMLPNREPPKERKKKAGPTGLPTAILFNGGVFKANPLRERLTSVLTSWAKDAKGDAVRTLTGTDLDLRGRARRRVLRPGAARQGRPHPRRHGPGLLHRRRDRRARGAGDAAADEGAVRRPVRHGRRHRSRHARPGVRPRRRRAGRVPLPRLQRPPRKTPPAPWSKNGSRTSRN